MQDHYLLLPADVAKVFAIFGVRDAVALLSYLQAFPSAVADGLHWDTADVATAAARLRGQLRGHVDENVLTPAQSGRTYGAIRPGHHRTR